MLTPATFPKLYRILLTVLTIVLGCAACAPLRLFPPTATPTSTFTDTFTFTPSLTNTSSSTFTPVPSDTPTASETFTPSLTFTPSFTLTPSLTFTLTLKPSRTPIPSKTPTPVAPRVAITTRSSCRYGPGAGYLYKYGLVVDNWEDVIGQVQILSRQTNGSWAPVTWLYIQSMNKDPYSKCWVNSRLTRPIRGDVNSVPDYFLKPKAPEIYGASHLYGPVTNVSAERNGGFVDIFWQAGYMTEDDYEGYMIEAYVCYKGKFYFAPVGYKDSFAQNANEPMDVVRVPDESGCGQASHAQIFAAEKHGYTTGTVIPWPAP